MSLFHKDRRIRISFMAASKNPSPQLQIHNFHHPWRSRGLTNSASLIIAFFFLLILPLFVFFFLPSNSTTFTRTSNSIDVLQIISFSSLSSIPVNDTVSPPLLSPAIKLSRNDTVLPKNATAERANEFPRNNTFEDLRSCDLFNGSWVLDRVDPNYPPGTCPYVDDAFNCFNNGRQDRNYLHYRWKPRGCEIPRFDGRRMLGMLKNKRVAFVGDSLNRNMWQSLICSLRQSLTNKSSLLEVSDRRDSNVFYSFLFKDHNCTIDYIKSPFLVQRWRIKGFRGNKRRETLRLDIMQDFAAYLSAHVIIFNTGHWWTYHKTRNGIDYFQEGNHVHSKLKVKEAFKKALRTWARWVDTHVNNKRSLIFFSGYSASHFRGGQWNSGGGCERVSEPISEENELSPYPWMMKELELVISKMKTKVTYLNITRMSDYRNDAHPSVYRSPRRRRRMAAVLQDCSHWCLPGVPDSWNQLLYAYLLTMLPQS